LFGDSACALNPLGDLYKGQVRQLAGFLGIPEPIIQKPPSADLWEGQTDEGELGLTYDIADEVLFLLVDQGRTMDEIQGAGYDRAIIAKIARLVSRNQFKRQTPLIAKIGA
jgi:NAD+ synthase